MPKHIPRQYWGVEHTFQTMHGKPLRAVLECEAYVPGYAWEAIRSSVGMWSIRLGYAWKAIQSSAGMWGIQPRLCLNTTSEQCWDVKHASQSMHGKPFTAVLGDVKHTFQAMHGKPFTAVLGCEAYAPG